MEQIYVDALRKLLAEHCTLQTVRRIEGGQPAGPLWQTLEQSGFADALLPEADGGAGLAPAQCFALFELCGASLLPVPLGETMLARAWLAQAGLPRPAGSIALAQGRRLADGTLVCDRVSYGRVADWVLVGVDDESDGGPHGTTCVLLPAAAASASAGAAICTLDASLSWPAAAEAGAPSRAALADLRVLQASALAAQLAGALASVLTRSLQYANERQQFGRPIGKFQAIQHQLSVIAEQVFAARMAAQLGCGADRLRAAIAKARTSQAALEVAALSHSIHGAIGFTAEFDLQMFTRRLHAWRQAAGSESYWHDVIGAELLNRRQGTALESIRAATDPV